MPLQWADVWPFTLTTCIFFLNFCNFNLMVLIFRFYLTSQINHTFFGLFWLILYYLPDDFDQGKRQKSQVSFCQLSFWHSFHIQDICSFYSAWIRFRDAEIKGRWGYLDEEKEEKETNQHPLGLVWDWWTKTWLFVINHCSIFFPKIDALIPCNFLSFFCDW